MARHSAHVALIVAALALSGCSFGHYVDPAQYPYGTAADHPDYPARRNRVASPTAEPPRMPSDRSSIEGTIGDGGPTGSVPARSPGEAYQAATQEVTRANAKAKDTINGMCRGC
jgi:hypothetical protein